MACVHSVLFNNFMNALTYSIIIQHVREFSESREIALFTYSLSRIQLLLHYLFSVFPRSFQVAFSFHESDASEIRNATFRVGI